ncbi:MAG: molybdate ABC transporter substrate-binding protein [Epsilonproteobacteria bacterium]|nr:molybdate ABC transporter substrate-binding protein [Campylobacterota bacterium]
MKKIFLLLVVFFVVSSYAERIRVAAAANIAYALEDLKKEYERVHPNDTIEVIIASSGKLAAQIMHGASYDIFLSANLYFPQKLYDTHKTLTKPKVYAKGLLALFSTKPRDFSHPFKLLQSDTIHEIAIANPKTAPYGKAAFELLYNKHLVEKLRKKFVYGESIGQTFLFTLKVADIGFVAASLLHAKKMNQYQEGVHYIILNQKDYTPIKQGVVVLKHAQGKKAVFSFYNYLFSSNAKRILQDYGYEVE